MADSEDLREQFEQTNDVRLLRRATALALTASRRAGGDHEQGHALANYAANLHWLAHVTGRSSALFAVERRYSEASRLLQAGTDEHSKVLANLLLLARQLFERSGDVAVLDGALGEGRAALAITTDGQRRAILARQLGSLLRFRFLAESDPDDLAEALRLLEDAYTSNRDKRQAAATANAFAAALGEYYSLTGKGSFLDRAVALLADALEKLGANDPDRAMLANNLANSLSQRFEAAGDPKDLEEAIAWAREALRIGAGSVEETRYRRTLGSYLILSFQSRGVIGELREAVGELRQAHRLAATGSDARGMALGALATALAGLAFTADDEDAAAESLEVARHAVAETSPTSTVYPARVSNLCMRLGEEAEKTGRAELLDEAIRRQVALRQELLEGHRWSADLMRVHANLLVDRSRLAGRAEDARTATEICRAALAETDSGAALRVLLMMVLARAATQLWRLGTAEPDPRPEWATVVEVAEAKGGRSGLDAGVQALRHAGDLRDWPLALRAAALAVSSLESLVTAQHTTSDRYDWLRHTADLSGLALEAGLEMDRPDLAVDLAHRAHAMVLRLATRGRQPADANEGWQEYLDTVADAEPVVIIAPGRWSGYAVVLSGDAIAPLPLPALTAEAVQRWTDRYGAEVLDLTAGRAGKEDLHPLLVQLGQWLGKHAIEPLLRSTRRTTFSVIDMGRLGGLPLNAAWWFDRARGRPVMMHEVARMRTLPTMSHHYAIDAPGHTGAVRMISLVGRRTSSGDLTATEAKIAQKWTTLTALNPEEDGGPFPAADVLHATGHAIVDSAAPVQGRITLPGGLAVSFRKLAEILERKTRTVPSLVLFTACQTVHRDVRVPGEHLGLASVALELGARTVVGTRYPISDRSMFVFATRFLRHLTEGVPPVRAWHETVTWMADASASSVGRWLEHVAADIGENDQAFNQLRAWVAGRSDDQAPFASPIYWAGITYVGG
ncbi:CHAT domain protein [Actinomadura rubteroloni]|uniref:CHAT domain protein n=2 Tax=Actinomadura rubteroloni TaxID=1926885 RepID=A0A2P4UN44_9ACTN|nr:CHAT domain protein [Actinomadura rubteroloni]